MIVVLFILQLAIVEFPASTQ